MIRSARRFELPETGFVFSQTELRSPSLIIAHHRLRGTRWSDHLMPYRSKRPEQWPNVHVLLRGNVAVDSPSSQVGASTELNPGSLVLSEDWGAAPLRVLSDEVQVLFVAWRGEPSGPHAARRSFGCTRATRAVLAAASELASLMDEAVSPLTVLAVEQLMRALRAAGLCDRAPVVENPFSPVEVRTLSRFSETLTRLQAGSGERLMAVDLADALGCSERTTLRVSSAYFRSLYVSVDSLRDYVASGRLWVAAAAMLSTGARTEIVSRRLGYSSPVALCHAFADAGLPSPGRLREFL
jgi:hypothetical protein